LRRARPVRLAGGVPTFEIDADAPMMALVGILRPRVIVTKSLVTALSTDEIQAGITHELAHWRARDNLKRLAIQASPDLLAFGRAGRAIERRWASAAEHAADCLAGGADPNARCALASALVKIARLMPQRTRDAEPIGTVEPMSTFGGGDLTSRVARLLNPPSSSAEAVLPVARWTAVGIAAVATVACYPSWLVAVHEATETLVRLLP